MIGIIGMMMTKIKMLRSQFIRKEVKSITSSDAESERFFGMTLWCEEDIENALEVCDVRPTAEAQSAGSVKAIGLLTVWLRWAGT